MMSKVKVAAGVLAVVLLAGWFLYTNSLKHERDRLLAESSTYQQTAHALAQELEANRAALEQREEEKERLANEKAALITMLNEVYANDQEAKVWADTVCPDGVLDCLLR